VGGGRLDDLCGTGLLNLTNGANSIHELREVVQ